VEDAIEEEKEQTIVKEIFARKGKEIDYSSIPRFFS